MATAIALTAQPIVALSSSFTSQNLWEALDVSNYDVLDLELGIVAASGGTPSGSITVQLMTPMQRQVDNASWIVPATNFANVSSGGSFPAWQIQTFEFGLLRYVRWKVSAFGGFTNLTLSIKGMGRKMGS